MRYRLDSDGYVSVVSFGCYLNNCEEYNGDVPLGYSSLIEWASNACINAYYINSEGNLYLDHEKMAECIEKEVQESVDNSPVLKKDMYGSEEVLDSQYIKETAVGEVVILEDVKTTAPRVKITGVDPSRYNSISIYTQGVNMMPCSAKSETINGVTFTRNYSGAITVSGKPTADIEYTVAGSAGNTTPLFVIKKHHDYYLNLGGFYCEMRYNDGESVKQQYVGKSGLLNLDKSVEVTHVVLKIKGDHPVYPGEGLYPNDDVCPGGAEEIDVTFLPQLEYGSEFTGYKSHRMKSLKIDFDFPTDALLPNEGLYPSEELHPSGIGVDYVLIEGGVVYACISKLEESLCGGRVGLFSDYNTIYATKDTEIEIEYSTNVIDVESLEFMQGKATTTNKFKVLEDGSIEAHNGYFSGKIEADEGYFKGRVEANEGYFKGRIEAEEGYFNGTITSSDVHILGGDIIIDQKEYYDSAVITIVSEPPGDDMHSAMVTSSSFECLHGNDYAYLSKSGIRIGYQTAGGDDIKTKINKEDAQFGGEVVVVGNIAVYGEKSRLADTANYGCRRLYCYETPSPMFGDLGEGQIDETGKCFVFFDDVFAETIDTECSYQVFLQPYGDGKCYVSERTGTHFVVCGTENMKFGWEVKAIQKHYDTMRLEEYHPESEADDEKY